jgi:hypothetical protein
MPTFYKNRGNMSISNDQTRKFIQEWFGTDGLAAILTAEKAASSQDKKIQILFRQNQLDFVLLHSQNVKKEILVKAIDKPKYNLWKPSVIDKTDEIGNLILELLPTAAMASLFQATDDFIQSLLPRNTQLEIKTDDTISNKLLQFLHINSACLSSKEWT